MSLFLRIPSKLFVKSSRYSMITSYSACGVLNQSTSYSTYNIQKRLSTIKMEKDEECILSDIIDKNEKLSKEHQTILRSGNLDDLHTKINKSTSKNSEHAYYADKSRPKFENYVLPHPIWTEEELNNINYFTHKKPTRIADHLAFFTVGCLKWTWDISTGFLFGRKMGLFNYTHRMWLLRIVYLESIAGVPGMMFGMARHLQSLRKLRRDRGWIITLISEAENERIHLLTAMYLYSPAKLLRYSIVMVQGIMCNYLFLSYLISPRYCHSLVGYLEEQACRTYSLLLHDIESGKHPEFYENASNLARAYWKLNDDATWYDVFKRMRADETKHRDVNHTLADIVHDPKAVNPFRDEFHNENYY